MTKQAFLSELSIRLAGLDASFRNEICEDISEHFIEGAAQGMSEEDICRKLGQPAVIAEQFLEEYFVSNKAGFTETPNPNPKPVHSNTYTPHVFIEETTRGIQKVSENQYNIDIRQSFNKVSDIKIEMKNSHVKVIPAEQGDAVVVTIKGRARHDRFTLECSNGLLYVLENTLKYSFNIFFNRDTLLQTTVYVPQSFSGSITTTTAHGDTAIDSVCGTQLAVKNSLKNIHIDNCRFEGYDVVASAGNLDVKRSGAESMKLRASAGNIHLEQTTGILDVHASAGNVHVAGHSGQHLKVKSSAGNVILKECDGEIDAHSSAGDVKVLCEGKILYGVRIHSSAGNAKLQASETQSIDLGSSAGDVRAYVNRLNGEARLSSGAGNVLLEARETNGNITANASVGNVCMRLPAIVNARIETKTRMGSIKQHIAGNEQSPYTLHASASMGSLTLEPIS